MTIQQFIITIYFVCNGYVTGYYFSEMLPSDKSWRGAAGTIFCVVMFMLIGVWLVGYDCLMRYGKWFLEKADHLLQFKFYWLYFRGGFYNMDDHRLRNLDMMVFKGEYHNLTNSLRHIHFAFVANLIFKRNNYTRRSWRVDSNNLIQENDQPPHTSH